MRCFTITKSLWATDEPGVGNMASVLRGSWRKLRSSSRTEAITPMSFLLSQEEDVKSSVQIACICPSNVLHNWNSLKAIDTKHKRGLAILRHYKEISLFYHKDRTHIKTSVGSSTHPACSHLGLCSCPPFLELSVSCSSWVSPLQWAQTSPLPWCFPWPQQPQPQIILHLTDFTFFPPSDQLSPSTASYLYLGFVFQHLITTIEYCSPLNLHTQDSS